MKTVGLITEYNPFHNGHLYHIERARELTGADRVVIVMSGDYVPVSYTHLDVYKRQILLAARGYFQDIRNHVRFRTGSLCSYPRLAVLPIHPETIRGYHRGSLLRLSAALLCIQLCNISSVPV